ncbi:MAG: terminase small subunit [Deltaproteobacteria bacterium]|nr:MAG: terminase small subunit [Deltaproteobacteria bacterium]
MKDEKSVSSDLPSNKDKLTLKQQRFVKAIAGGAPDLKTAAIQAGYKAKSDINFSKIGSQLLENPRIKSTIAHEIASGRYDQKFETVWQSVFESAALKDPDHSIRMQAQLLCLKAIDQISKIGGLEAPKQLETRSLSLSDLFPQGRIAR